MIKILHVITALDPGGAETLLLNFVRSLNDPSYQNFIAYIHGKSTLLQEKQWRDQVKVFDLTRNDKFDPRSVCKLLKIIKAEKIDIVHTHLPHAGVFGRLVGKLAGAKVVTTYHYGYELKRRFIYTVEDKLLFLSDSIIAMSYAVKNALIDKGISAEKIDVIYNAVDLKYLQSLESRSIEKKKVLLGSIGRLIPSKRFVTLIEALVNVRQEIDNIQLEIIGDGPEREHLEKTIRERNLEKHVRLWGTLSNRETLKRLSQWDIFAFTPVWEGFGVVIIEAMAYSKPVVVTDVGGISELVRDGQTGFLIPPDRPDLLAEKIIKLSINATLRSKLGAAARKDVEKNYSMEVMVEKVEQIYKKLFQGKSA
jgi:glycosyltransferase involved in cell wall biosynthesis